MAYSERLRVCKLPTLHFRHIRGDMVQMYKFLTGKYDPVLTPQLTRDYSTITRGNDLRLKKVELNMICVSIILLIGH